MSIISCVMMGGLGNQLFQIFTTIAYAIRYKRKIVLPYYEDLAFGTIRPTYWNSFLSPLKNMTTANHNLNYSNDHLSRLVQYRECGHHYNQIPSLPNKEFMLFGYFQSPLYFENEKDTIFSLIRLAESKKNIAIEYPQYVYDNAITISMHFRIGDYKNLQENHPLMPYEYYYNALMHMLLNLHIDNPINVLYFCEEDDNDIVSSMIQQCSQEFTGFKFIKVDDSIEDWKQMLIMSNCHHHIIANSSFSWWGAYLNNASDKIVCYPSLWFGPALASKNVRDMFPPEWTRIDVLKN